MMTIIYSGDRKTCKKCRCIFEYEREDVKTERREFTVSSLFTGNKKEKYDVFYVNCPHCGAEIEIHSERIVHTTPIK